MSEVFVRPHRKFTTAMLLFDHQNQAQPTRLTPYEGKSQDCAPA